MKSIHQALRDARAIMAERGLAKGRFMDSSGAVCIRGALLVAGYGDSWGYTTYGQTDFLRKCELAMDFPRKRESDLTVAAEWNNAKERTLEEVLDRFDQGIEATKRQEAEAALTSEKGARLPIEQLSAVAK